MGGCIMHEPTHAPGWRGRPASYSDLQSDLDTRAGDVLAAWFTFGCVIGAAACGFAALIAWWPTIAAWAVSL